MTVTLKEILNCLSETDRTIQQYATDLDKTIDERNKAIDAYNELKRTISDTDAIIARFKRQSMAQRVIGVALCFDMQDIQYKFGAEWENDKKFDCSAFMQVCFRVGTQGAVKLPRTSHDQSLVGTAVPFDQIEPGDTLHYDFDGDGKITHVGLAMDNVWMIHTNNEELDINIIKIADYNKGKGLVKVRRHIS